MGYGIKLKDIKEAVENIENGFTVETFETETELKITSNEEYAILTINVYLKNDDIIKKYNYVSKM